MLILDLLTHRCMLAMYTQNFPESCEKISQGILGWELLLFRELLLFQRELFLTMIYTITSPYYSLPSNSHPSMPVILMMPLFID